MRRVVHSVMLGLTNLAALLIGFAAYHLLRTGNQILVQIPIAVCLTVVIFSAWLVVACRLAPRSLGVDGRRDGLWIYALAFVWAAAVFAPIHFLTQGYVTAFSNIVALWGFQLVANAIAVPLALMILAACAARHRR